MTINEHIVNIRNNGKTITGPHGAGPHHGEGATGSAGAPDHPSRRRGGRRPALLEQARRIELFGRIARGEDDAGLAQAFGLSRAQVAKMRYNHAAKISRLAQDAGLVAGAPEDEPPPVQVALTLLGARVERLRGGFFRLDGRPAGLKHIMGVANRLRVIGGKPAIPYPGVAAPRPGS